MFTGRIMRWATLGLIGLLAGYAGAAEEPAFPGAEGFGAFSRGGKGGRIYSVTTLEDYHPGRGARDAVTRDGSGEVILPAQAAVSKEPPIPGSLREAVEAEGPRTVVFAVAGTIELKAPLVIRNPYITITGHTAPAGGICLKNYGVVVSDTHDVIIRYLRIRPGDSMREAVDGLSIGGSRNVIVDHCSTSWALDENLSVSGAGSTAITVQWCIISESLHDSWHPKGPHGMGSLLRTDGEVSFHHNLFAHNNARSPRPGTYGELPGLRLDFRNNVIYNWGAIAGYTADDPATLNYVANYIKPGPSVKGERRTAFRIGGETTRIYAKDNVLVDGDAVMTDDWAMIARESPDHVLPLPVPTPDMTTQTAQDAYEAVLEGAGATKPRRDAVDARIVEDVRQGRGAIINSQEEVGGWPDLTE